MPTFVGEYESISLRTHKLKLWSSNMLNLFASIAVDVSISTLKCRVFSTTPALG
jgi:hypothetical protein